MPAENGNRELGRIEATLEALAEQFRVMREENRQAHKEFHEAFNAIAQEGYTRRIEEMDGRVGRIEKTGIGAMFGTVAMFVKMHLFGK